MPEEKPTLRLPLILMYSRRIALILLCYLPLLAAGQVCTLKLGGKLVDLETGERLRAVSVYVNELQRGTRTDSLGRFTMDKLCPGDYHIVVSHVGCEAKQVFVHLHNDTTLTLSLEHTVGVLNKVTIKGKKILVSTQHASTLSGQEITDHANENLSNMLESVAGVSTLKNGNGIAKPVVHGLYGNRLTILNNGIAQSGQQWGNDHSPEIDPLVANKITVIKGVSALEYPRANLGSVILIQPKKINNEPHLHGRATYFFESNGLSNGLNLQLQQYSKRVGWKVNGTLKKSGDKKSSTYYLNNTGNEEANLAIQLEKVYSKRLFTDLYFSTFNTTLGVLRGSHIGNTSDLEQAFSRAEPFFTEDKFSYGIEAPKQKVQHHLLKLHAKYFINTDQFFDFTIAAQLNNRKEFDVRRSGRTDIPALSLNQKSYYVEGKYNLNFGNQWNLRSGVQFNIIDNANNPETGILPLIPDYLSYETGIFTVLSKRRNRSLLELGVRYDLVMQNVAAITQTIPRKIIRYDNIFHNYSATAGWSYSFHEHLNLSTNLGYANRNPAINELYSAGLHQGVSGIEEGNEQLKKEQSTKASIGLSGQVAHRFSFETLLYYQRIADYIYLRPDDEIRLTIRGAFPVFIYDQTDVQIYGLDGMATYHVTEELYSKASFSYIKGDDLSNNVPLIYMPSNNISVSMGYEFSNPIHLGSKKLENLEFVIGDRFVFQQNNILPSQDFVLPPKGYNLMSFKSAANLQLSKIRLRLLLKVDNVLNVAYRDYLNRQRYFANDLGRNVSVGVHMNF